MSKPSVLKVGELSLEQGEEAYIMLGEEIDHPDLGSLDLRIHFKKNNSFKEVEALVNQLNDAGFTLIIEPR